MFGSYTRKKALLLGLAFQAYPIILCVIVTLLRPEAKMIGYIGIFAISEVILAVVLFIWSKRSEIEVLDEMEQMVRQKVQLLTLRALEWSMGITMVTYFVLYREMPTLMAFLMIGVPAIIAQVVGNIIYRRI